MYVCMYVCMNVRMYVLMYVSVYVCTYVRMCGCVYLFTNVIYFATLRNAVLFQSPCTLPSTVPPAASSKDNCLEMQVPFLFPEDKLNGLETSSFPFTSYNLQCLHFFCPCNTLQLCDPDTIFGFISTFLSFIVPSSFMKGCVWDPLFVGP